MTNNQFYEVVLELRKEGKTWEQCARFLLKAKAVSNKVTGNDIRDRFQEMAARVAAGELQLSEESEYDKACRLLDEFIGRNNPQEHKEINECEIENILVISDPHVPYQDNDRLKKAIDIGLENGCTTLVINGDYLNGDRLSTHAKFKFESFQEEVATGVAILEELRKKFNKVYLLNDNHVGDRWRRFIGNMIPPDLHFLLTHPYDYMCKGMNNVIRAGQTHNQFQEELSHFMILGDAMFSHGFVSGKDGESARKVQGWYKNWKTTLNLPPVRVWLHGHSHNFGIAFDPDGAVIQTGTLASLEGLRYSLEGHLRSTPPTYGITILKQHNGVTDLSSIRLIKL